MRSTRSSTIAAQQWLRRHRPLPEGCAGRPGRSPGRRIRRHARGSRARWTTTGDAAHRRLAELDPAAAAAVHPHDRKRLVRALELAEEGASLVANQDRLWAGSTRRPTLIVGLDVAPDVLERRIRERTETMFARGVVDEVRAALSGPVSRTAEKTLGLAEIAELGPDALEPIVARTRRYAAYQRKWMRRIPGISSLLDGARAPGELADDIVELDA